MEIGTDLIGEVDVAFLDPVGEVGVGDFVGGVGGDRGIGDEEFDGGGFVGDAERRKDGWDIWGEGGGATVSAAGAVGAAVLFDDGAAGLDVIEEGFEGWAVGAEVGASVEGADAGDDGVELFEVVWGEVGGF